MDHTKNKKNEKCLPFRTENSVITEKMKSDLKPENQIIQTWWFPEMNPFDLSTNKTLSISLNHHPAEIQYSFILKI